MFSPSNLLSVADAARRLPYSEPALRHKINRGELEAIRIGRHIYLTEPELRAKFGVLFHAAS